MLYCWDTWCSLATTSALILLGHGYREKELFGGVAAWKTLHLPEEIVPAAEAAPAGYTCEARHLHQSSGRRRLRDTMGR